MTRAAAFLISLVGLATGCGDDAPPIARLPVGLDSGPDPERDASPGEPDAAIPPLPVEGDDCEHAIDVRASYEPGEDGAYHITGNLDDFPGDDFDGCGLPNYDRDAVYVYVPPADGRVRFTAGDNDWVDLQLRTICDDPTSSLLCVRYDAWECTEEPCGFFEPVTAATPVYLVVDGKRINVRTYEVTLQFYPWLHLGNPCEADDPERVCAPGLLCRAEADASYCRETVCGDGLVEGDLFDGSGEECDDGNVTDADGCTSDCRLDGQGPGGDTCDDATPLYLVPTNDVLFAAPYGFGGSDTSPASANLSASCASTVTSPDEVWILDLEEPTPLTVAITAVTDGYRPVVYLLGDDGTGQCSAEEIGCSVAAVGAAAGLELESVEPGRYWVVVDGLDEEAVSAGAYTIEAAATVY